MANENREWNPDVQTVSSDTGVSTNRMQEISRFLTDYLSSNRQSDSTASSSTDRPPQQNGDGVYGGDNLNQPVFQVQTGRDGTVINFFPNRAAFENGENSPARAVLSTGDQGERTLQIYDTAREGGDPQLRFTSSVSVDPETQQLILVNEAQLGNGLSALQQVVLNQDGTGEFTLIRAQGAGNGNGSETDQQIETQRAAATFAGAFQIQNGNPPRALIQSMRIIPGANAEASIPIPLDTNEFPEISNYLANFLQQVQQGRHDLLLLPQAAQLAAQSELELESQTVSHEDHDDYIGEDGNLYDSQNRVKERYTYDEFGEIETTQRFEYNEDGTGTAKLFDAEGNLLNDQTLDEEGRPLQQWNYDENGEISSRSTYSYLEDGSAEVQHFDANDHMTHEETQDVDGNVIERWNYDENDGLSSRERFDLQGRVTERTNYNGSEASVRSTERYTYNQNGSAERKTFDAAGQLTRRENLNPQGHVIDRFNYNNNQLVSQTRFERRPDGTPISSRTSDASGVLQTSSQFDARGRLTSEVQHDRQGQALRTTTYQHNDNGTSVGTTRDARGLLLSRENLGANGQYTSITHYRPDGQVAYTDNYNFDSNSGRLTSVRRQNADGTVDNFTYSYNQQGRFNAMEVRTQAGLVERHEYDANGRETRVVATIPGRPAQPAQPGQPAQPAQGATRVEWRFDNQGNLTQSTTTHADGRIQRDTYNPQNGQVQRSQWVNAQGQPLENQTPPATANTRRWGWRTQWDQDRIRNAEFNGQQPPTQPETQPVPHQHPGSDAPPAPAPTQQVPTDAQLHPAPQGAANQPGRMTDLRTSDNRLMGRLHRTPNDTIDWIQFTNGARSGQQWQFTRDTANGITGINITNPANPGQNLALRRGADGNWQPPGARLPGFDRPLTASTQIVPNTDGSISITQDGQTFRLSLDGQLRTQAQQPASISGEGTIQYFPLGLPLVIGETGHEHETPDEVQRDVASGPTGAKADSTRQAVLDLVTRASSSTDTQARDSARQELDALVTQAAGTGPEADRARQMLRALTDFASSGNGEQQERARTQLDLMAQRATPEARNTILSSFIQTLNNNPNAPGFNQTVENMGRIAGLMGMDTAVDAQNPEQRVARLLNRVSVAIRNQEGEPLAADMARMMLRVAQSGPESIRPIAAGILSSSVWQQGYVVTNALREMFLNPPTVEGLRNVTQFCQQNQLTDHMSYIRRDVLNANRPFDVDRNSPDYARRAEVYFEAMRQMLARPEGESLGTLTPEVLSTLRGNFDGDDAAFLDRLVPHLPETVGRQFAQMLFNQIGLNTPEEEQRFIEQWLPQLRQFVTPDMVQQFRQRYNTESSPELERSGEQYRIQEQFIANMMMNLLDSPAREQAGQFLATGINIRYDEFQAPLITRASELAGSNNAETAGAATAFLIRAGYFTNNAEQATTIRQRLAELGQTEAGLNRLITASLNDPAAGRFASSVLQSMATASPEGRNRVVSALLSATTGSATEAQRSNVTRQLRAIMQAGGEPVTQLLTERRNDTAVGAFVSSLLDNPPPPSQDGTPAGQFLQGVISNLPADYRPTQQQLLNVTYLGMVAATGRPANWPGLTLEADTSDAARQQFSQTAFEAINQMMETPELRSALRQQLTRAYVENPDGPNSRQLLELILQAYAPDSPAASRDADAIGWIASSARSNLESARLLHAIANGATGRDATTQLATQSYAEVQTAVVRSFDNLLSGPLNTEYGRRAFREAMNHLNSMPGSDLRGHLEQVFRDNAPVMGPPQAGQENRFVNAMNAILQLGGPTSNHAEFAEAAIDHLNYSTLRELLRTDTLDATTRDALAHAYAQRLADNPGMSYENRRSFLDNLTLLSANLRPEDICMLQGTELLTSPSQGSFSQQGRNNVQEGILRLTTSLLRSENLDQRVAGLEFAMQQGYNESLNYAMRGNTLRTLLGDEATRERTLDLIARQSDQVSLVAALSDPRNLDYLSTLATQGSGHYSVMPAILQYADANPAQRQTVLNSLSSALRSPNASGDAAINATRILAWYAQSDTTGATRTWLREQISQPGGEQLLANLTRVAITVNDAQARTSARSIIMSLAADGQLSADAWRTLVRAYTSSSSSENADARAFMTAVASGQRELPATAQTYEQQLSSLSTAARNGSQRALEMVIANAHGHYDEGRQAAIVLQQIAQAGNQTQRENIVRTSLEILGQYSGISYLMHAVSNIALGRFDAQPTHATAEATLSAAIRAIPNWQGDRTVFTPLLLNLTSSPYYPQVTDALNQTLSSIPRNAQEYDAMFRSFVNAYNQNNNYPSYLQAISALGSSNSPFATPAQRTEARALINASLERLVAPPTEGNTETAWRDRMQPILDTLNAFITDTRPTWLAQGNPPAGRIDRLDVPAAERPAFVEGAQVIARLLQSDSGAMTMQEFETLTRMPSNSALRPHIDRLLLRALSATNGADPQVQRAAYEYLQRRGLSSENTQGADIMRDYATRAATANPQDVVSINEGLWNSTLASLSGPITDDQLRILTGLALGRPGPATGDRNALAESLFQAANNGNNRALTVLAQAAARIGTATSVPAADRAFGQQLQTYMQQIAGNQASGVGRVINVLSEVARTTGNTPNTYLARALTELRNISRDVLPPVTPTPTDTTVGGNRMVTTTDAQGRRVVTEVTPGGLNLLSTTYSADNPLAVVSRTQFTYLNSEGQPTFNSSEVAVASSIVMDANGRVVERFTYPNLAAVNENRPRIRETIAYTENATAHTQTQTRQSFDLTDPANPRPLSTDTRTYNTQTGETSVVSTQSIQGIQVQQTARYDWAGNLVAMQRTEGTNQINYTIENGQIRGATMNGNPITDTQRRDLILQSGRQADAFIRIAQQINSLNTPDGYLPTPPRTGSTPTGTLVWGQPDGQGGFTYNQARVENGRVLSPTGQELGRVHDDGRVILNDGRQFNIGQEESAAFHGIGSDGMRLDLAPQNRATRLSGTLTSPDGQSTVVIVGGNIFNNQGRFVGHIDRDGMIVGPGQDNRNVQLNSQFEGWRLQGMENDRALVVPSLSSHSVNGRFFWTPPGGSHTEYIVRMGAVINRATGEQVGLMSTPFMDSYRNVSGGSVQFFGPDNTVQNVPLENMTRGVFDLRVSAPTGIEPLRMQFISTGTQGGEPGTLFSWQAGQQAHNREIARLRAANESTSTAQWDASNFHRWFQSAMEGGWVSESSLNEYFGQTRVLDGRNLQLDQNWRMYNISRWVRDVQPLPYNTDTLSGSVRIPTFNSDGGVTGHQTLTITNGIIYGANNTQIGEITGRDGSINLTLPNGQRYTNMSQLEGAIWRLSTPASTPGGAQNFDRISTGGGVLTRQSLRNAGNQVADYFQTVLNFTSNAQNRTRRDTANRQRDSYYTQIDSLFENGISSRNQIGDLYGMYRNVAPADTRREPASIQPPTLTTATAETMNGRLRLGNEFYEIRNGQLYPITQNGDQTVTATTPVGRMGSNYVVQWNSPDRPPTNLAERQRVLLSFTLGGSGTTHQVIGMGAPRMTSNGMIPGGLVNQRELVRQVAEAQDAAIRGDRQYFRDRPWITGGFTNWIAGDPESVMRNLLQSIGRDRNLFENRLGSLFTEGFNQNFSNADLDSRVFFTEILQNSVVSTVAMSTELTQMVGNLQNQVRESAVMAALTVATMGVGAAFNAGRTALAARNLGQAGIRLAPQLVARGVQEGLYLTRTQRVIMMGTEMATQFGVGGATSVVVRGSDGADHTTNFLTGGIEGLAMGSGHQLTQLVENSNRMIRGLTAVANALYQSTAFAGAQAIREGNADHFNLPHIALGTITMLAARPAQLLGFRNALGRSVSEALAFGGLSGVEPALQQERARIERQLGMPEGSLSLTSAVFWDNVNVNNITTNILQSAGWSALPIAVGTGAFGLARRITRPEARTSPEAVQNGGIPLELVGSHSNHAVDRATQSIADTTRTWTNDLSPHSERINQYVSAGREFAQALQAEAARTGRPVSEIREALQNGTGSESLQHLYGQVQEHLANPQVREFQARLEQLQATLNQIAQQNGHPTIQVEVGEAPAGGSSFHHGQNRMVISAHDLLSTAGGGNVREALLGQTAQQSQDALVIRSLVEELGRQSVDTSNPDAVMSRLQELFQSRTGYGLDANFAREVLQRHQNSQPLSAAEVARANQLANNMLTVRSIFGESASTPAASRVLDMLSRITEPALHGSILESIASLRGERLQSFMDGISAVSDTGQAARFFSELGAMTPAERAAMIDSLISLPTAAERGAAINAIVAQGAENLPSALRYLSQLSPEARRTALRDLADAQGREQVIRAMEEFRAAEVGPPRPTDTTGGDTPTPAQPTSPSQVRSGLQEQSFRRIIEQGTTTWTDLSEHRPVVQDYVRTQTDLNRSLRREALRQGVTVEHLTSELQQGRGPAELRALHERFTELSQNPVIVELEARRQTLQQALASADSNNQIGWRVQIGDLGAGGTGLYRHGQNTIVISAEELLNPASVSRLQSIAAHEAGHRGQDIAVIRTIAQEMADSGMDPHSEANRQELLNQFQRLTGFSLDGQFAAQVLAQHRASAPLTQAEMTSARRVAESLRTFSQQSVIRQDRLGIVQSELTNLRSNPDRLSDFLAEIREPERQLTLFGEENPAWLQGLLERVGNGPLSEAQRAELMTELTARLEARRQQLQNELGDLYRNALHETELLLDPMPQDAAPSGGSALQGSASPRSTEWTTQQRDNIAERFRRAELPEGLTAAEAMNMARELGVPYRQLNQMSDAQLTRLVEMMTLRNELRETLNSAPDAVPNGNLSREQWQRVLETMDHYLRSEQAGVNADSLRSSYNSGIDGAIELLQSFNNPDFNPQRASVLADIFVNSRNLPTDIRLPLGRFNNPNYSMEALQQYASMLTDLRGITPGTSGGHGTEWQAVRNILRAFNETPWGQASEWTFLPTSMGSRADQSGIDGFFINLSTGELRPINFKQQSESNTHPWQFVTTGSPLLQGNNQAGHVAAIQQFLAQTAGSGLDIATVRQLNLLPSSRPEGTTLPFLTGRLPEMRVQLDAIRNQIRAHEIASQPVPEGLRLLARGMETAITGTERLQVNESISAAVTGGQLSRETAQVLRTNLREHDPQVVTRTLELLRSVHGDSLATPQLAEQLLQLNASSLERLSQLSPENLRLVTRALADNSLPPTSLQSLLSSAQARDAAVAVLQRASDATTAREPALLHDYFQFPAEVRERLSAIMQDGNVPAARMREIINEVTSASDALATATRIAEAHTAGNTTAPPAPPRTPVSRENAAVLRRHNFSDRTIEGLSDAQADTLFSLPPSALRQVSAAVEGGRMTVEQLGSILNRGDFHTSALVDLLGRNPTATAEQLAPMIRNLAILPEMNGLTPDSIARLVQGSASLIQMLQTMPGSANTINTMLAHEGMTPDRLQAILSDIPARDRESRLAYYATRRVLENPQAIDALLSVPASERASYERGLSVNYLSVEQVRQIAQLPPHIRQGALHLLDNIRTANLAEGAGQFRTILEHLRAANPPEAQMTTIRQYLDSGTMPPAQIDRLLQLNPTTREEVLSILRAGEHTAAQVSLILRYPDYYAGLINAQVINAEGVLRLAGLPFTTTVSGRIEGHMADADWVMQEQANLPRERRLSADDLNRLLTDRAFAREQAARVDDTTQQILSNPDFVTIRDRAQQLSDGIANSVSPEVRDQLNRFIRENMPNMFEGSRQDLNSRMRQLEWLAERVRNVDATQANQLIEEFLNSRFLTEARMAGAMDAIANEPIEVFAFGTSQGFMNDTISQRGGTLSTRGGNFGGRLFTGLDLAVSREFADRHVARVQEQTGAIEQPAVLGIALPRSVANMLRENNWLLREQIPDRNGQQFIFTPEAISYLRERGFFFNLDPRPRP